MVLACRRARGVYLISGQVISLFGFVSPKEKQHRQRGGQGSVRDCLSLLVADAGVWFHIALSLLHVPRVHHCLAGHLFFRLKGGVL